MRIAAIQMSSRGNLTDNLNRAAELISQAVESGSKCVVLPEYFYCMGKQDNDRLRLAEAYLSGPIQDFLSRQAFMHQIWLIAGSVPLASNTGQKFYNSQLLFDPKGQCVGRYDKVHLFGFDNGVEAYQESDTMIAGEKIGQFVIESILVRPSICYDLRFPEYYRKDNGYELITAPAAFTYTTGSAHWELLLRTRAIENQCYLVAAAQVGEHESGAKTYGHSMIVDPWGKVLGCLENGEGVVSAELDLDELKKIRTQLPALHNRVYY
jgi:deaminated glutathione amidase